MRRTVHTYANGRCLLSVYNKNGEKTYECEYPNYSKCADAENRMDQLNGSEIETEYSWDN